MNPEVIETNRIIKEIHNSFYSMDQKTDTFLQQQIKAAYDESILKSIDSLVNRYGFKNSKNADILDKDILFEREELNDVLNECAVVYPGKKFITDEQIAQLCQKYNLLLTTPDRFIGEIPERNIQELNDFNPKGSEKKDFYDPNLFRNLDYWIKKYKVNNDLHSLTSDMEIAIAMIYASFLQEGGSNFISMLPSDNDKISLIGYGNEEKVPMSNTEKIRLINGNEEIVPMSNTEIGIDFAKKQYEFHKRYGSIIKPACLTSQTMIAATSDLLDIPELGFIKNEKNELILGLEESQFRENLIPDPIVFHKVRRGAIIITAWGIESQDELVFNPNIN